jgi:hypothetical protein
MCAWCLSCIARLCGFHHVARVASKEVLLFCGAAPVQVVSRIAADRGVADYIVSNRCSHGFGLWCLRKRVLLLAAQLESVVGYAPFVGFWCCIFYQGNMHRFVDGLFERRSFALMLVVVRLVCVRSCCLLLGALLFLALFLRFLVARCVFRGGCCGSLGNAKSLRCVHKRIILGTTGLRLICLMAR